jgi:hypothetical protein
VTTQTGTGTETAPADAMYGDELASRLGVSKATLKAYTRDARNPGSLTRPPRRRNFPVPGGKALVDVPVANAPQQPVRRVWVPWWHRAEAEEFLRSQEG